MRVTYVGHATVVIESAGVRLIIDPWLTQSLDRFWEHYPPLREETIPARVDVVLLSHHHYDHCHVPSLHRLNRDAIIIYPATDPLRTVTNPGGGSFVLPWLFRRLGFRYIKAVRPLEKLQFGTVSVLALPSAVTFPEMTYVISDGSSSLLVAGDSMLHPTTLKLLQEKNDHIDLAILPIHSTATDACLRNRSEKDDIEGRTAMAEKTFKNYLTAFKGSAVIPGAFGWRVAKNLTPLEPECDWMNHRLFPLTVVDGYRIGTEFGTEMHIWGPGDVIELGDGHGLQGMGDSWDNLEYFKTTCAEFELEDPETPMPSFEPAKIGEPVSASEHQEVIDELDHRLATALAATPYFMTSIEMGRRTSLRITGYDDLQWKIDFSKGTCEIQCSDGPPESDSFWIAERTFLRLMHSDLPYGHSWGCWVGNSRLVDSLFTEPRYFMRYVETLLQSPDGISRYGF